MVQSKQNWKKVTEILKTLILSWFVESPAVETFGTKRRYKTVMRVTACDEMTQGCSLP